MMNRTVWTPRLGYMMGAAGVLALSLACGSNSPEVPESVTAVGEPDVVAPSDEPTVPAPTEAEVDPELTVVPTLAEDTVFAWRAEPDPEMGEDDPRTVLMSRPAAGGSWTRVTELPSRPTAIDVAPDGRLAMVLQSSEHLDELRLDGHRVSMGLPEFPAQSVNTTIQWQDPAPNGAARVEFRGQDGTGRREDVTLVETADGWELDPNNGECVAITIDGQSATFVDGTSQGQAVDLNDDGVMEVLMMVDDSCGTGACVTPIYGPCTDLTGGYQVLGETGSYETLQVLETRTNGWLDVRSFNRGGPESGGPVPVRWAYDGTRYKAAID